MICTAHIGRGDMVDLSQSSRRKGVRFLVPGIDDDHDDGSPVGGNSLQLYSLTLIQFLRPNKCSQFRYPKRRNTSMKKCNCYITHLGEREGVV